MYDWRLKRAYKVSFNIEAVYTWAGLTRLTGMIHVMKLKSFLGRKTAFTSQLNQFFIENLFYARFKTTLRSYDKYFQKQKDAWRITNFSSKILHLLVTVTATRPWEKLHKALVPSGLRQMTETTL